MLVTIAIPVYNGESYLRDAIQSVVNQTFQDWELYLINDGSTDNSLAIMQEYALNDIRIKVIDDGQNKGLVTRLNQSIETAIGKYYARMDADDIMFGADGNNQLRILSIESAAGNVMGMWVSASSISVVVQWISPFIPVGHCATLR